MRSEPQTSRRPFSPALILLALPLVGVIAALALVIANGGLPGSAPPTVAPATQPFSPFVDRPAPNFELPTLDGGTVRLSSLRGRVVFLNFWATWCEPCKRELPAFEAFMAYQNPDTGPIILAVNIGETVDVVNKFLGENRITNLSILLDEAYRVETAYQVEFYPTTFVIDPTGAVHDLHLGELKLADLNAYVEELVPG